MGTLQRKIEKFFLFEISGVLAILPQSIAAREIK